MDKQTIQIIAILALVLISVLVDALKKKAKPPARGGTAPGPRPARPEFDEQPPPWGEMSGFPSPEEPADARPAPVPFSEWEEESLPEPVRRMAEDLEKLQELSASETQRESLAATLARVKEESAEEARRRSRTALLASPGQLRRAMLLSEVLGLPAAIRGDVAIRNAGNERAP